MHSLTLQVFARARVLTRVRARARVRALVRARVCGAC